MSKSSYKKTKSAPDVSKPTPSKSPFNPIPLVICLFLVLATAGVYARVAGYPFIDLDDGPYVLHNQYVQGPITANSIRWAFTAVHSSNWHPLTWISHMLDCSIYGIAHPGGHHVTNLLLHILNTLLLFLLLSRMTRSTWRSGFVAALFALHPLHVESVAWIAERKDVLSTFFLLLTMLAYVSYTARRGIWRYVLVIALYAFGLMAKPMLVSLPLVLLMLDYWPLKRFEGHARAKTLIIEKLPLLALAAASCAVTYWVQLQNGAAQTLDAYPIGVRAANATVAYSAYVLKMLWPTKLALVHSHPGATLPVWQVIASGAALAIATFTAVRMRRTAPYVFVGWLWYVVMLIPVIGLLQVGMQATADRYTYVPCVGLFVAIAWGVPAIAARFGEARRAALAALAAAVIVSLAVGTWIQVGYWRSTESLAKHAVEATDRDNVAVIFLATCWRQSGKTDQVIDLLSHSLGDRPGVAQIHNVLGNVLYNKGESEEAEQHYREAVRIQPNQATGHYNLATALLKKKQSAAAESEFRKAAELDQWYSDPHFGLAIMYASQRRLDDALGEFRETARLDPQRGDAHCGAATMLYQLGRWEEALPELRSTIELDPNQSNAHLLLGQILMEHGTPDQADEAISHLERSTELTPKWGAPHNIYAMALCVRGDYVGAWREVELARRCGASPDPAFIQALSQKMPEPGSSTSSP